MYLLKQRVRCIITLCMASYSSVTEYVKILEGRAVLPEGFLAATTTFPFVPRERPAQSPYSMNLSLILLEKPTSSFAGVFTKNAFPGAPVTLARSFMAEDQTRGVLINNKISNVRAPGGVKDAEEILAELGVSLAAAGLSPARQFFIASTGIIGWRLPVQEIKAALPGLSRAALAKDEKAKSCLDVSRSIMTTDSFPKIRSAKVEGGSIVATAKGAGMIEPNLATMLVFIMTDLILPRDYMREILPRICAETFNTISIDSDQSTSDMVLLFSSNAKPLSDGDRFAAALRNVCEELAEDIVRNGEGTGHVIKVTVEQAPSVSVALAAGKAIVNSPLVKTAIFGNDPNVGRILSALGDYAGSAGLSIDPEKLMISLGNESIFENGAFSLSLEKETALAAYMNAAAMNTEIKGYPQHDKRVEIRVKLAMGRDTATVRGSDLSYEYVKENADYRT